MRLYCFTNYYLSDLQKGLQTAHLVSELFVEYPHNNADPIDQMLYDWALQHKTIIICNGGNQRELQELFDSFCDRDNWFPYTYFSEDEQSLNKCLTCVGIILPEKIYKTAAIVRSGECGFEITDNNNKFQLNAPTLGAPLETFSQFEVQLISTLNQYRLA